MSEYYDTELIRKRPEDDREFQEQAQRGRAGHAASRRAIYSDLGLRDQYDQKKVDKDLRLKRMGIHKKGVEGTQALQRESLAHTKRMSDKRYDLARDRIDYDESQGKISAFVGAGTLAVGAFTGWQAWKQQKIVDEINREKLELLKQGRKADFSGVKGGWGGNW